MIKIVGNINNGIVTTKNAASMDSQPASFRIGTNKSIGNRGYSKGYSCFISPMISPQFLNMLASSNEIVSWVLYIDSKIANPIATSAAAIAIAIAVKTQPFTSP